MSTSELDRWDYNDREVLYNDSPGIAEEGWKPADPVLLILTIRNLIKENEKLRELLREAKGECRLDTRQEIVRALNEG